MSCILAEEAAVSYQPSALSLQYLPTPYTPSRYNRERCLVLNRLLYFYERYLYRYAFCW